MSKRPQTNGKTLYEKTFKHCYTSPEDAKLIRKFVQPSKNQATCFARFLMTELEVVKKDRTLDTDKIAQQFIDYGEAVPEDLKTVAGINIEEDEFADRLFSFMKNNKKKISFVFHGDEDETYETKKDRSETQKAVLLKSIIS